MRNRYLEQLQRVRRYFDRFAQLKVGRPHTMSSDNYQDDIYAFFQNCYQLKDWIKNDPACASWTPPPERLVNESDDLRICADLANGLKHLRRDKPRSDQNPQFAQVPVHVIVSGSFGHTEEVFLQSTAVISTESGLVDGYDLAVRCIAVWERYVQANAGADYSINLEASADATSPTS